MTKVMLVEPDLCGGCCMCEGACSFFKEKGEINPEKSRVRVIRREWMGLHTPTICHQCEPPICRNICPNSAISRDEGTGAIMVDREKCNMCLSCARTCPFGAIHIDSENNQLLICDLCGGEPKCVEWCPKGVLRYSSVEVKERRRSMDKLMTLLKECDYDVKKTIKK